MFTAEEAPCFMTTASETVTAPRRGAGRRAGEGVAVAAAAIDSLQTAALDSLQEVMAWLPQRSNRRSGRGEERERRRSRPMDTSAWLPIDGPS